MDIETTKKIEWYESRIARRWPDQEVIDRAPIDVYDFIEVMKIQAKRIAELETRLGDLAEVK